MQFLRLALINSVVVFLNNPGSRSRREVRIWSCEEYSNPLTSLAIYLLTSISASWESNLLVGNGRQNEQSNKWCSGFSHTLDESGSCKHMQGLQQRFCLLENNMIPFLVLDTDSEFYHWESWKLLLSESSMNMTSIVGLFEHNFILVQRYLYLIYSLIPV